MTRSTLEYTGSSSVNRKQNKSVLCIQTNGHNIYTMNRTVESADIKLIQSLSISFAYSPSLTTQYCLLYR